MKFIHTFAALALATTAASGAQAFVDLDFPREGSSYFSATNGAGVLAAGGQSAYTWTTGDYIEDSFAGTGLASANYASGSFQIENVLGGDPGDLLVDVIVNGVTFGQFGIAACGFCREIQTISFNVGGGAAVAGDSYTVRFQLASTRADGDGSIAWLDGGELRLALDGGGVIPEPASWAMMIAGFGLVGGAMRRRREIAA